MGFPVGDVFGASLRTVWQHLVAYLRTQGPFVVLTGVFAAAMAIVVFRSVTGAFEAVLRNPTAEPDVGMVLRTIGAALVPSLLLMLASTLVGIVGAFFGIGATVLLQRGEKPTLGSVWTAYRERFAGFLGAAFAALIVPLLLFLVWVLPMLTGDLDLVLAGVGGMFLTAPVAIYLLLRWYLAPAAAMLGEGGAAASLRASGRLMVGAKLHLIALVILLGIVNAIAGAIVTTPVSLATVPPFDPATFDPDASPDLERLLPSPAAIVAQQLAGTLVALFFAPVFAVAMVLVYQHRTRPPAAPAPPPVVPAGAPPFPPPQGPAVPGAPGPPPPRQAMGACPKCGTPRAAYARFCTKCGEMLG